MKTPTEIQARIDKIEADERKHYPPASVEINAPLALIQVALDVEADALRWVLTDERNMGSATGTCPPR